MKENHFIGIHKCNVENSHASKYFFQFLSSTPGRVLQNGCICYIGKADQTYFPISIKSSAEKKYKGREVVYHGGVNYCVIKETEAQEDEENNSTGNDKV